MLEHSRGIEVMISFFSPTTDLVTFLPFVVGFGC